MNRESGFAYPMLLLILALVAISVQAGSMLSSRISRAEKERELLFRGRAYRQAIRSYYQQAGPRGHAYPPGLEDLLEDPRFPGLRHLRKLYKDPISGAKFSPIFGTDGGVQGVASPDPGLPLKRTGFESGEEEFEEASSYSQWKFVFVP